MSRTMRTVLLTVLALASAAAAMAQENGIQMEVLLRSSQTWDGAALPAYPDAPPEISIVKLTVPPGTELPIHRHPFINGGVLLSGMLTVRTEDGQETHLNAGDALLEVVDTWHAGRNHGAVPTIALVFYVGTPHTPLTILKSSVPATDVSGQPVRR